jgi:hypothetical protein
MSAIGTIADGLAPARSGQVSGVVPPFAERTLATTECFDFGDQCTVLPTRNGDYGRSREVARRQLASDGPYAEAVLSGKGAVEVRSHARIRVRCKPARRREPGGPLLSQLGGPRDGFQA